MDKETAINTYLQYDDVTNNIQPSFYSFGTGEEEVQVRDDRIPKFGWYFGKLAMLVPTLLHYFVILWSVMLNMVKTQSLTSTKHANRKTLTYHCVHLLLITLF